MAISIISPEMDPIDRMTGVTPIDNWLFVLGFGGTFDPAVRPDRSAGRLLVVGDGWAAVATSYRSGRVQVSVSLYGEDPGEHDRDRPIGEARLAPVVPHVSIASPTGEGNPQLARMQIQEAETIGLRVYSGRAPELPVDREVPADWATDLLESYTIHLWPE